MLPNLLNMALSVTGQQNFSYQKFLSRSVNEIGLDIAVYAPPVTVSGSPQAVPRSLLTQMGLDLQGNYLIFYLSKNIEDVKRDVAGDQIIFGSKTYKCLSETDWFPMNGWTGVLSVQVQDKSF